MSRRKVLSSAPLLVRGSETGGDSGITLKMAEGCHLCCYDVRGSSTKYSLGPFTETKHNFMEIFIASDTASVQLFFNIFAT
jgi:hypothetical protein